MALMPPPLLALFLLLLRHQQPASADSCGPVSSLTYAGLAVDPSVPPGGDLDQLTTPFAQNVTALGEHPIPRDEHPNPAMKRDGWCSLNGVWELDRFSAQPPATWSTPLLETILVPFPLESALSGVRNTTALAAQGHMWYRRQFELVPPTATPTSRDGALPPRPPLLLHFEAATWETTVWVNGKQLGPPHQGGYDAFSYDISSLVTWDSDPNTLVVGVRNPGAGHLQPSGKQRCDHLTHAFGVGYTCSSGIWAPVWLEQMDSNVYVETDSLSMVPIPPAPNAPSGEGSWRLNVTMKVLGAAAADVAVTFICTNPVSGEQLIATLQPVQHGCLTDCWVSTAGKFELGPASKLTAALWSPDSPKLWQATVNVSGAATTGGGGGAGTLDSFETYFGLRSVTIGRDKFGIPRPLLNGEFIVQVGTLDQGFWPEGIYSAPSDEAMIYDIAWHKEMGFNAQRHHMKVEPRRWYYHADRLGLMVWQDMPTASGYNGNISAWQEYQRIFKKELSALLRGRGTHPSIIQWDIFNEGAGTQFNRTVDHAPWFAEVEALVRSARDGRLIDMCSGCNALGFGDMDDLHHYAHTPNALEMLPYNVSDMRPSYIGEIGGFILTLPGHDWQPKTTFGKCPTESGVCSGCVATAMWAGYPVYDNVSSMSLMFSHLYDALAGNGTLQGVVPGAPPCARGGPSEGACGVSVQGEALPSHPASKAATATECATRCGAVEACVAWDWAYPNASSLCTLYGTMQSLVEAPMAVSPSAAGHKGFIRAGACTTIYTGLTDIETECDGFLTYDRRAPKYNDVRVKAALAMLKAAATPMPVVELKADDSAGGITSSTQQPEPGELSPDDAASASGRSF